jgi:hypothetical protein
MRIGIFTLIAVIASFDVSAACRTFHYDHDGNANTPLKFRVACEQTYEIRKIPKYRVPSIDVASGTTRFRDPKHIRLPLPKPKCTIPSVYQFTMMQTLSQCVTTR